MQENEQLQSLINQYVSKYLNNEADTDKLKKYLKKNKLALCVGAGLTSMFVGEWRELLRKLLTLRCCSVMQDVPPEELKSENGEIVLSKENVTVEDMDAYLNNLKEMFVSSTSNPLEIGEYLMYDRADHAPEIGRDREEYYREVFFAEQVRYIINSEIEKKTGDTEPTDYIWDMVKNNAETACLQAVVKLCLQSGITEIINYNFDLVLDLLLVSSQVEDYFHCQPVQVYVYSYHKPEPVFIWGKKCKRRINIYHVHGIADNTGNPMEPIIFSENSYQSYQRTTLNWSNIWIAEIMSRYHMMCVGFSGDDVNFRMLRRFLSERENNPVIGEKVEKKEVFLLRSYQKDIEKLTTLKAEEKMNEKWQDCAYACSRTYLEMVSAYFEKQLDVRIIWADGFTDMADIIVELMRGWE